MPKLKGSLLFIPSLLVIVIELKYLILDNIQNSDTVTLDANQYWALAIPVFVITFLIALLIMWVGYTMIVSKESLKMTYDSAYEEAAGALSSNKNNATKDDST